MVPSWVLLMTLCLICVFGQCRKIMKNDSTKPTMTESGCSFLPRALYQVLLASCDYALGEIPNQLLVDQRVPQSKLGAPRWTATGKARGGKLQSLSLRCARDGGATFPYSKHHWWHLHQLHMVLQLATQLCDVMTLSKTSKNGKYVEDNQLCTAILRVSSRFEPELLMLLYIPKWAGKPLIGWLFLIGLLHARCRLVVSTRPSH